MEETSLTLLFSILIVGPMCTCHCQVEDVVKLQGTFPMYFNGAKVSDKLYKMLREHQVGIRMHSA